MGRQVSAVVAPARRRIGVVLGAVVGVVGALTPVAAGAQFASIGVALTPSFTSPVAVGQDDAPALLQLTNFSSGGPASETLTVSGIHVNPSCGTSQPQVNAASPCATPDFRPSPLSPVLAPGPSSAAGTTCPGGPFLITGPDGDGDYSVTPTTGPLTLAPVNVPGSSCAIAFTFDVVQRPTDGATFAVAVAQVTSPSFPGGVSAGGSSAITVDAGQGRYTPLSPARIEDTRLAIGGLSGQVGPGATVSVQVGGRGGVPASASAVVMNVTVTQPTAEGYLTLYPNGTAQPLASNLNFTPGKTVPNLVTVKLGADGRVALFNSSGSTHAILDVAGYFAASAVNTGRYNPLVPARIADTRLNEGGVRLGPGQSIDVQVTGRGGAPATGVSAAVLNVAATGTTAESYLTIHPTGEARPVASNLNFSAGNTVSNRTMTKVGSGGKVTIYNNAGATDVVVDVGGTYSDATGAGSPGGFRPLEPSRVLDTRGGGGPLPGAGAIEVQIAGLGGVPASGAQAVILNVAVTQPAGPGFLAVFPSGTARPVASDLNYAAGETRANLVVVRLGANGKVGLYSQTQTHVVIDVAGYFI